ncbi:right-handed parallel beta-helix repeat-containing protein [bacterium]|nr:right-handed parallel beta-helix repeat-containing protein [candidate division CSSED10-310 bacterium]
MYTHDRTTVAVLFVILLAAAAESAVIQVPSGQSTIQAGIDAATDGDWVVVADGTYCGTGNKGVRTNGKRIIVTSANGPGGCVIDRENSGQAFVFNHQETAATVLCGFTLRNGSADSGGGVRCMAASNPTIINCIFTGNHADEGAALCCCGTSPTIRNCLFFDNHGVETGAVDFCGGHAEMSSCTIAANVSQAFGGGILCSDSSPTITDCIVWGNEPDDFHVAAGAPMVTYCDVGGGFTGAGNLDDDPLFVSGSGGAHYLSHQSCGQPNDSPCKDAGSGPAQAACHPWPLDQVCMNQLTTRSDDGVDAGVMDMGFHYLPASFPTPSPYPDQTATPPPTATPEPTSAASATALPTIPPFGVSLMLSQACFRPGDEFLLRAVICNPGPDTYEDQPLVTVLDVYGLYFWHPMWTETFTYDPIDLGITVTTETILHFTWPEEPSQAEGLVFYGAVLSKDCARIMGLWSTAEFGWIP